MAFSNAANFQIDRSVFNDIQGDYNHHTDYTNRAGTAASRIREGGSNRKSNVDGDQDIRSLIHSAMKPHIHTDAFHDSGARRNPSSCYPGTRETALEAISGWIRDPASHCLWLHGSAGIGKSTIAQTVTEQCDQDKTLGASYFFTRDSICEPPPLFPTLAYQLMSTVPDLDAHLWEMIRGDRTVFQKSMTEQLDRLIVQPFLKLVNRPSHIVIVIDGLDECGDTSVQEEIVQLILGVRAHSIPLQFLIASRPEPNIRRAFESSPHSSPFHLPLDASLDPDRDIRHFLCNELWWIYQQSLENGMLIAPGFAWPSPEAIDQLVEKSSGHFIYASTVVKFIQEDDTHLVERLDVVLQTSSESSSPAAMDSSIISPSAAFQWHLDQLYLHILRKGSNPGSRAELARVLHAVDTNNPTCNIDILDTIFAPTGGVHFLLRGFRSIIKVTPDLEVRFLHASLSDFLRNPARSCEFHLDRSHFNADLAYEYARVIAVLSPTKLPSLTLAMNNLEDCVRDTLAHPALLYTILKKVISVIDSGPSKSLPPCIRYSRLDYLLRIKIFLDSHPLRNKLKTIQRQLQPQLTELSDIIFTVVRVLGANFAVHSVYAGKFSLVELGQFIGMPNGEDSEAIFRRALGLNYADLKPRDYSSKPIREIRRSLSRWLLVHRRKAWGVSMALITRGILYPPTITVDKYSWTWAWDIVAYLPDADEDTVHHLDILYCCLRTLLLGLHQPLNHGRDTLYYPSLFVRFYLTEYGIPTTVAYWVLKGIDFSSVWQALSTLGAEFYPRLISLQSAFDGFFVGFGCQWVHLADKNPSLDGFFQNMYSRLMQDPLVSRTIPITYALFVLLGPGRIDQLLGLPGLCTGSPVRLEFSAWLSKQLKSGRVKLRHGFFNDAVDDNHNTHTIEDYMSEAHERLTIACARHLASRVTPTDASPMDGIDREVETYAQRYWSSHLRYTNHSERLFETLRCVVTIQRDDVEDVIQWLGASKSPGAPEDILLRWRAARLDYGTARGPPRKLDTSLFDQYSRY